MFGNFINRHDVVRLVWGIRHGYLPLVLSRLTKGRTERVKDAWKVRIRKRSTWWMIPEVRKHWNYLVTGDENVDYREYVVNKYFVNKSGLKGLCLGCGGGEKVLEWARLGIFERIDAYDISTGLIEKATKRCKESGYKDIINFRAADIYEVELAENSYDIVIMEHALHHFSPLEEILKRVKNCLGWDGYFVVDEFVGPSRFQWTDKQLRLANAVRSLLPDEYRRHIIDGSKRRRVIRPSRLSMILKDPSEAVESARIMPLLKEFFNVVEVKGYHGAILHLVFEGIAQNFMGDDEEMRKWFGMCVDIEDILTEMGEVDDDFVVAVCRK